MAALDKAIEALRGKQNGGSDPLQAAMLTVMTKLAERETQELSIRQLANGLVAALDSMQAETRKLVKSLDASGANKAVTTALSDLAKGQKLLAKQVEKMMGVKPKDTSGPIVEAIDRLRAAIQSVQPPDVDLSPVLSALAKQKPPPAVDLKPVLDKLDEPDEYVFEVERENVTDRIKSVTAKRIA